jgi:hypothetical protein
MDVRATFAPPRNSSPLFAIQFPTSETDLDRIDFFYPLHLDPDDGKRENKQRRMDRL